MRRTRTRSPRRRATVTSVLISMLVTLGLLLAPGAASASTQQDTHKAPTRVTFTLVGKDGHITPAKWGFTAHEKLYLGKKRVGDLDAKCWFVDRNKSNHKIFCVADYRIYGHGTIVATFRGHEKDTSALGRVVSGSGVFKGIRGNVWAKFGDKQDTFTFWVTLAKPLPKGHPHLR